MPRRSADPAALAAMAAHDETSGVLRRPLITMHTSLDQQVPALHQFLYMVKTSSSGSLLSRHVPIQVERYGHCNFTPEEVILAFVVMIMYAGLSP